MIVIQANPLFDNQIDETNNGAFSLNQGKDQTVKNIEFSKTPPTTVHSS